MSIKIQSLCWKIKLPATQKLVLICLSEFTDDSGRCFPSIGTIAERTGLNPRSVRRAVSELEKVGLLTRSFCTGKRTDYTINPCHRITPDRESPLTESTIPLTESTLTPDRGVNITTKNHQEPPIKRLVSAADAAPTERTKKGSRLSTEWKLPMAWGRWAVDNGMDAETVRANADVFRDYWVSKSGAAATKNDWEATWRNWVRKAMQDKRKGSPTDKPDFIAKHTDKSWRDET